MAIKAANNDSARIDVIKKETRYNVVKQTDQSIDPTTQISGDMVIKTTEETTGAYVLKAGIRTSTSSSPLNASSESAAPNNLLFFPLCPPPIRLLLALASSSLLFPSACVRRRTTFSLPISGIKPVEMKRRRQRSLPFSMYS